MEILSETRISQQVITRIGRIPLTRRPLELGPHRPPVELRTTTLELGNIELRPIDLNSRAIRPATRRRLPRPRAELRTSNLIIRMLIQVSFPTDLTNTRRRLINFTPRISRIFSRFPELFDFVPVVTRKAEVLQSIIIVGGVEVAPGAAFGHMRIEPAQCLITCLYVAGAVFEQLGNGLVTVGRTAVIGARLVRIGMVMVSTVAVIAVVHRVIVRSVPVGISGSSGITSSTSIRRIVLLRRIRSPGLIGPRALGTGVLRLTALGAAVVAGPSRRVAATRAIRALVGPGPRTMSPTSMRMRGRATQPAGMRSTTKSMSSTSPRHTQPSRAGHSSTSRMSRRRTPTMRPTGLISKRTAPTPTGMTGPIGGSIGMRSPRTTTMTATSIRTNRRRRTIRMTRNRRTRPRTTSTTRPTSGGIGMRSPKTTTSVTATGIRMDRRRRGARMRGRRPRIRMRSSRPTTSTTGPAGIRMRSGRVRGRVRSSRPLTSTTGPTGAITSMTGPALARMTGPAGVGMTGLTAGGVRVRGLGTAARVTTAPAFAGMTTTGVRMRGGRVRCRVRGSRPIAGTTGSAGVGVTGAGVGMAGSAAGGIGVRGPRTAARVATAPAGVGVTGAGVAVAGSAAGVGVRGLGTTGMTATGIRMGRRRRGARMRGRRVRIRMRSSRPITSMTGPAGTITDMTGPAGTVASVPGPAGIAVAGSTAGGTGMRGLRTTARVTTAPVSVAVTGPTGVRMRGGRPRGRVRGIRPIAGTTGPTGAITSMTGPAGTVASVPGPAGIAVAGSAAGGIGGMTGPAGVGVAGAGVGMAGSAAGGTGVRGLGTAARVATAPAGIAVTGPALAGVTGPAGSVASVAGSAAGVGVAGAGVGMASSAAGGTGVRGLRTAARVTTAPASVAVAGPAGAGVGVGGGGVGGCCGGVDGLGGLGVGMAGDGIETVISSHARTSTGRRGVGRCSRHCWNGARERIQTMISPRPRPGRRVLAPVTGR